MLEVEHISKLYGSRMAVDNVSFVLEKGGIYGFLGANGAGKSTTMNIMTGYLAPSKGRVKINGFDVVNEAEKAKKFIGYLPEVPPLYPDMTVYEYLQYAGELKGIPKKELRDAITGILKMTNTGEIRNRLIRNLSKGYRQRTGFAQALLGLPEIIILDEPMSGLDPAQIMETRNLILSLKEDHAVILSSHILAEVSAVCDEIIIISGGRLKAQGKPDDLLKRYGGDTMLDMTLISSAEDVRAALLKIASPDEMTITPDENDASLTRAMLKIKGSNTDAVQVGKLLLNEGIAVCKMEYKERSLEDIFLSVTGSEESDDSGSLFSKDINNGESDG